MNESPAQSGGESTGSSQQQHGTTLTIGKLTVFVRHDEAAGQGRFSVWVSGHQTAELDYAVLPGPTGVWDFLHTYAEPAMRGTGVADALVEHAMNTARAAGLQIVPSCPYIPVWLGRHPEYVDLVRGPR